MTSLADELDLDPAFSQAGGAPPSLLEEEEEEFDRASTSTTTTTTTTTTSPVRSHAQRRSRRAGRGRSSSSGLSEEGGRDRNSNDAGFSLADELNGGGGALAGGGASLANEVNGGLSIDDELNRAQREPQLLGHSKAAAGVQDDEARARRDQEHYLVSSEIMNDSVRQTDAFLLKLRKIADTATVTSSSSNAILPSRASSHSLGTGGVALPADDTASIENTAAGIVRQLREHAQLREAQVRELQECDRILRRAFEEGGEYLMALAEMDASEEIQNVEISAEDHDPLGVTAAAAASARSTGNAVGSRQHSRSDSAMSQDSAFRRDELDSIDEAAVLSTSLDQTTVSEIEMDTKGPKGTAFQDLIKLQQSTNDLIVSLGAIHEHSQIAHATMGDAARRIRNIRNVLSNWQDEVKLMEKSQSWISAWESGHGASSLSSAMFNRPKDIRQWTQGEMDKFERILDEAHIKAKELLMPVKDPVLERLAASKA